MSYLDTTFSARGFGMKKDFYNCSSPSRTSIDSLKPASETENDISKFIISKFEAFDFSSEFCDNVCVIPAESPVHNSNNAAIKDGFDFKYQSTKECSSISQSNMSNYISTENDDIYKDECLSVAFSSEYDDI